MMDLKKLAAALRFHNIRAKAQNGVIQINGNEFTIVSGERSHFAKGETLSLRFKTVWEFISVLRNDRFLFVRDPKAVAATYSELIENKQILTK